MSMNDWKIGRKNVPGPDSRKRLQSGNTSNTFLLQSQTVHYERAAAARGLIASNIARICHVNLCVNVVNRMGQVPG